VADEQVEPSFEHHPAANLPKIRRPGAQLRVIAGDAWGKSSAVKVFSRTLYVDAVLDAGAVLELPDDHVERAAYVAVGQVRIDGVLYEPGQMIVFTPGSAAQVEAVAASRVMLLGGDPLDGLRYIWWNFVSSKREHIERAKSDWREQRFAPVPGDAERIPLPED
jgi:redox-sensitive bicupin YhaK (pirin superfamily)